MKHLGLAPISVALAASFARTSSRDHAVDAGTDEEDAPNLGFSDKANDIETGAPSNAPMRPETKFQLESLSSVFVYDPPDGVAEDGDGG